MHNQFQRKNIRFAFAKWDI